MSEDPKGETRKKKETKKKNKLCMNFLLVSLACNSKLGILVRNSCCLSVGNFIEYEMSGFICHLPLPGEEGGMSAD